MLDGIKKHVRQLSPTEFEIDRSVADQLLDHPEALVREARAVPEQQDGRFVGVRLYGIRPDGLLGLLGLQDGDRPKRINGFDLGSPEQILEAYARLRGRDHLTLTVERRGGDTDIDLTIR